MPQTVEQLPDALRFLDRLMTVPEQVIEVPKICSDDVPMRAVLRATAGGTAGGSADDRILFSVTADYGAARRHSSSWSWRAEFWSSRFSSWTESIFLSGLWSRSLIFPVEAFNIFAQARVHPLLRTFQLVFRKLWMSLVKVFFALFHQNKKSAMAGSHSSQRVPASFSPSTPAPKVVSCSGSWSRMNMGSTAGTWTLGRSAGSWRGSNPRWWWRDGQYVDPGDN